MLEGLRRGYAVVSINYRMSGEALFPKNINDVKAAIRWIRANAKQYYFNPDKIAGWGGSAGGNLSSLAGTSGDVKALDDLSLGNSSKSSRLQAVVDWFGPTDFLMMDPQLIETGNGKPDHNESNSPESLVLGKKITEIPEKVKEANPETYITKDDPPFFIEHGTKDHLVPTQQSTNFAAKLKPVLGNEKVTLHLLEGAKHGGPEFRTPENLDLVFDFLDKYLKH
jgi:acetyl esterase/lipase